MSFPPGEIKKHFQLQICNNLNTLFDGEKDGR